MSFESNINRHLKTLKKKLGDLKWERASMFHDCDCEYCDVTGLNDEYTDADVDAIDRDIEEVERTIKRVKDHAERHGVKVPA